MTIVFALTVLLFLYTMIGYPILLDRLARRYRRPVRKDSSLTPSVTVLIPVRNGGNWIKRKLESVLALDYPRELLDVLVVSDGSTDSTEEIAAQFAPQGVRLIRIPPGGKPAALNAGRRQATGEIILFTDVRQEIEAGSLRKLVACFADPTVGVVSGDVIIRQSGRETENHVGFYRKFETRMRDSIGELDSMFGAQGAFYSMRRELTVDIPHQILLDDMYQPLSAFVRGYRLIMEMEAVSYDEPVGLDSEFWRKVRTLAGNYQILAAYPEMWTPGKRLWWHFLSYKVARLLLPFLLIVIAISSFYLPAPFLYLALAGQVALYGAALVDRLIPEGGPIKKITSAAATFLVMMAAAFCAPFMTFLSREKLWRPTAVEAGSAK